MSMTLNGSGTIVGAGATIDVPAVARVVAGKLVATAYGSYGGTTSFTGQIPLDNTSPQVTEGDQIVALSYTPKSATNKLRVRFRTSASPNGLINVICALFVGPGTDAKATSIVSVPTANYFCQVAAECEVVAGTTSTITIQARLGLNAAGSYLIGAGGGAVALFAGTLNASLVVEEYEAP